MMRILDDLLYRPLWSPADAGGGVIEADAPAEGDAGGDGGAEPRGGSVRENLERGFNEARRAEPDDRGDGRTRSGRFAPGGPRGAAAAEERAAPGNVVPPAEAAAPAEGAAPAAPVGQPPKGWAKEAQESWAQLPPTVQAAVMKREADMQRGVDELKSRYAELDAAVHPHLEAIQRHGHTPAQAVDRLFKWFQALAANPDAAFPALMQSFNWSPAAQAAAAQPQAAAGAEAAAGEEVPPAVRKYISDLETKIARLGSEVGGRVQGLEGALNSQIQAKTEEAVNFWAKDKHHFQTVRGLMAQLLASGAVPLKDGQVDLDTAYDMAVYAHPDVRSQVLTAEQEAQKKAAAEKAAAERAAQTAQATQARRAATSLAPGAPGSGTPSARGSQKRSTVREALMSAIEEVRQ